MQTNTHTGRLVHDDHHRTADMLNRLEAHLNEAETRGIPSLDDPQVRALVTDLSAMLDRELGAHFDFEEQAVFPLVAEGGAYELTRLLTDEHEAMRPIGRRLQRYCALALAEGFDEDSYAAFVHFGWDLTDRLTRHLQTEEGNLLPALEILLLDSPALDEPLAAGYRAAG